MDSNPLGASAGSRFSAKTRPFAGTHQINIIAHPRPSISVEFERTSAGEWGFAIVDAFDGPAADEVLPESACTRAPRSS